MYNIVMFTTREELRELTGLPDDNYDKALWDAGFNLDDWDVGFQSDKPMEHVYGTEPNEDIEEDYEYDSYSYGSNALFEDEEPPAPMYYNNDAYWLLNRMDNYCCGYSTTEYNGKYYYLVHHA